MSAERRHWITAPRFTPLVSILIGALGGGVYWFCARIWPASVAVILSMLATTLVSAGFRPQAGASASASADFGSVGMVFAVLVKFNALMALSAANLPFALPPNLALGLIMIAGHGCSRALVVASRPASQADIGIALAIGFSPAALIGIPGLIGLAAAIVARIAFTAYVRRNRPAVTDAQIETTRQLTEVCFYLGALASWTFI
jgi:adenosylcobinamide-GDP ribazoletransferase